MNYNSIYVQIVKTLYSKTVAERHISSNAG